MDGLFYNSGVPIHPVTLGEIGNSGYTILSADSTTTGNYESYTDIGYIGDSLEPLSLGATLGFGLITIFALMTYGVSKAISLVRIKNQ